jgi:hypothetical protein
VRTIVGPSGTAIILIPWNWRDGAGLTALVDSQVDGSRRIDFGEGDTQYLEDEENPDSVTDVHWLASLSGVACDQHRVDVVIDTDGLFILFDRALKFQGQRRLVELRSMDRQALLAGCDLNRWIPSSEITGVRLSKTRFSRVQAMKATLTITTTSQEVVKVHLASDNQIKTARDALAQLLGSKFRR